MDYPQVDPHGSPIPDKEGNIKNYDYKKLSECKAGDTVQVLGLNNSSKEFLEFLNSRGISLKTQMEIKSVEAFDSTMVVSYEGHKPKISALKSANVYLLSASNPLSMHTFQDFKIKKQLANALDELGYEKTTPIQQKSFSPIMAGKDFVGISQTGTGKTIAYLLPILQELKYSESPNPRALILAPTRELVIQIVDQIKTLTPYLSVRAERFCGSTNEALQSCRGRRVRYYCERRVDCLTYLCRTSSI